MGVEVHDRVSLVAGLNGDNEAYIAAKVRRLGYFEAARDGTLFLDEIGDISASTQTALLRVIEGKEFFRVGGTDPIRVNVRVVSATKCLALDECVLLQ